MPVNLRERVAWPAFEDPDAVLSFFSLASRVLDDDMRFISVSLYTESV